MKSLYYILSVPSILEKQVNHRDSDLQVLMNTSVDAEWYELSPLCQGKEGRSLEWEDKQLVSHCSIWGRKDLF